jgi:hypothetical protein
MTAQVRFLQGRYVGGRVPYGYLLVDAGPHPNKADARWGRRLQKHPETPKRHQLSIRVGDASDEHTIHRAAQPAHNHPWKR